MRRNRTKQPPREELTASARFSILERDRFTCAACGSRPGNDGLEVDHLLPWSLGGTHDPENLTTLCRPCNRGKGARVWIPPSLMVEPVTDRDGFAVWRRFGTWNLEVCADGLILNWPQMNGYLWFGIESSRDADWISHLNGKASHQGCDDGCRGGEIEHPDRPLRIGPPPLLCDLIEMERRYPSRHVNHSFMDLSRALDFARRIYAGRRAALSLVREGA